MGGVLVGDSHPLCKTGLIAIFDRELCVPEVFGVETFAEVLHTLDCQRSISLAVLDVDLPGMHGLDGLRRLSRLRPALRIAMISEQLDRSSILKALAAGLHGFIPKSLPAPEMTAALRSLHVGQIYVPALVSPPGPSQVGVRRGELLTDRQHEVINLLAMGRSNKEIGRVLGITEGTVKVHLTAAFRQLGVHNRVSAASAFQAIGFPARTGEPFLPGMMREERRATH